MYGVLRMMYGLVKACPVAVRPITGPPASTVASSYGGPRDVFLSRLDHLFDTLHSVSVGVYHELLASHHLTRSPCFYMRTSGPAKTYLVSHCCYNTLPIKSSRRNSDNLSPRPAAWPGRHSSEP